MGNSSFSAFIFRFLDISLVNVLLQSRRSPFWVPSKYSDNIFAKSFTLVNTASFLSWMFLWSQIVKYLTKHNQESANLTLHSLEENCRLIFSQYSQIFLEGLYTSWSTLHTVLFYLRITCATEVTGYQFSQLCTGELQKFNDWRNIHNLSPHSLLLG